MPRLRLRCNLTRLRSDLILLLPSPALPLPDLARNRREEGRVPRLRRVVAGSMYRCRCTGFAVLLWWRARLVLARWAPQLASTPSLSPVDPPVTAQALHPPFRSPRRTPLRLKRRPCSDRAAAGRRADSQHSSSRPGGAAANDRARPRKCGAKYRTAQGGSATNGPRELQSHWGTQGEPGRNETDAREGIPGRRRYRPRRSRLRACASPSGRISRRMQVRGRGLECRVSGCTKTGDRQCNDCRRLVPQQRSDRHGVTSGFGPYQACRSR